MAFGRKTFKKKGTKSEDIKKMGKIKHIKTEIDGVIFDSKMEAQYYELLKCMLANEEIKSFELQPKFLLQDKFMIVEGQAIFGENPDFAKIKKKTKAPTILAIKYIGDFEVHHHDGSIEIVDTKGIATADFKLKEKMFMMRYPHLKFSVITYDKKEDQWIPYKEYAKRTRERKKLKNAK